MSSEENVEQVALHKIGVEVLERNWGWYLALGIVLVALGTVAVAFAAFVTLASVVLFGWLLLVAGGMAAGHAFWRKRWGGFFIDLLSGVLYVVVGLMIVAHPGASAAGLTLLIAFCLMFGGITRILIALTVAVPHRGWLVFHGVIVLLLGMAIWHDWPLSGMWVIGLFLGIEMILNGWTLVMLGLAVRAPSSETDAHDIDLTA